MQQCGFCLKVYDESEYCQCPYCAGILDDDFDDDDVEEESYEMDEEAIRFNKILDNPGVYDDEGEFIRCPSCGTGLRKVGGITTCPNCGPV